LPDGVAFAKLAAKCREIRVPGGSGRSVREGLTVQAAGRLWH